MKEILRIIIRLREVEERDQIPHVRDHVERYPMRGNTLR